MMKIEGKKNGGGGQHLLGFPILKLCPASGLLQQSSCRKKNKLQRGSAPRKKASRMHMTFLPILVHIFLENTKLYNKKPI